MAVNTNELRLKMERLWADAHIDDEDFRCILNAADELDDVRTERNILRSKLLDYQFADILETVSVALAGASIGAFLALMT